MRDMDLEWKKYPCDLDEDERLVWVSDFVDIKLRHAHDARDGFGQGWPVWAKADIVYPEPPKKERHRCERTHKYNIVEPVLGICEEDESGNLHLSMTVWVQHPSSFVMRVDVCPFCGFSNEKK